MTPKTPKKKTSTNSRGNYYKRKTKQFYEDQGYTVEYTEFVAARPIGGGKMIYMKKDILASDGIAYNDKDFILWNAKHTITGDISVEKSRGKKKYEEIKVPEFIKKELVIWEPRKKPTVIRV